MASGGRGLLAGSLLSVVSALSPTEVRADEAIEIVGPGGASALGVGVCGSLAAWIALPALRVGGDLRPLVEIDAIDFEAGVVAAVLRIDWTTERVALSVDWSPNTSVGAHARLALRL